MDEEELPREYVQLGAEQSSVEELVEKTTGGSCLCLAGPPETAEVSRATVHYKGRAQSRGREEPGRVPSHDI